MNLGPFLVVFSTFVATGKAINCFVCNNVRSNRECRRTGRLQSCTFNEICQNEVRRDEHGVRITKRCKQRHACESNFEQNSKAAATPTQCNARALNSVCRCCCDFNRCNAVALFCSRIRDNTPRCLPIEPPRFGRKTCQFEKSETDVGTICRFSCNEGYTIDGAERSVCISEPETETTKFDNPVPVCRPETCGEPPAAPENGFRVCSPPSFNPIGSRCEYGCNGFRRHVGPLYSTCIFTKNGPVWDEEAPECIVNKCADQGELQHGRYSCSDGTSVTSVCNFECTDEGYNLFPPDLSSNICLNDTSWNFPAPCCARSCPPYAVMDVVIVLDSSSSIGDDNWELLKTFVSGIIRNFMLGVDAAQIGLFRYNAIVDTDTQILLNAFTDTEALIAAYDRIPYNGAGTRTGQALAYARDNYFLAENGNRPGVRNVLLVITDGRSQDDVDDIAKDLRAMGILTFVFGIIPSTGRLDRDQLLAIAGKEDSLVIAEFGFQDLNMELTRKLSAQICGNPCED
ncbi:uncharacterized protein LOC143450401 [Clavelina lepadiformis]|uniref:uncharacterized protein LOC143450401 n=1 Tax=Clavelina lepadiformis TaxID=159417 RepID=UPI00404112FF